MYFPTRIVESKISKIRNNHAYYYYDKCFFNPHRFDSTGEPFKTFPRNLT